MSSIMEEFGSKPARPTLDPGSGGVPASQMSRCMQLMARRTVFLWVLLSVNESAIAANLTRSEKVEAVLTSAGLQSANIPGAAVLVLKDGRVMFERGYGIADMKRLNII